MLGEFMTSSRRGAAWFAYQSSWGLGGFMEIGMAWLLLESSSHGWRYLAVFTALTLLVLCLTWTIWMPVSPRQSLLRSRLVETRQALDKIADTNSQPRYTGDFADADLHYDEKRGSLTELLRPARFLRLSLQLAVIEFASGFNYYGLILLNMQVPILLHKGCDTAGNATSAAYLQQPVLDCLRCDSINYLELLIPTLADLATALLNAVLIERFFGRRLTLAIAYGVATVLIPFLGFCMHSAVRISLFFVIRFFITSGYNVLWLFTIEAYPTTLRSTAVAFLSAFSRMASIIMPFVAQVFITRVSLIGGLFIFSGILGVAALSAALLPIETKDRPLLQTAFSEENASDSADKNQHQAAKTKATTFESQQDYGTLRRSASKRD